MSLEESIDDVKKQIAALQEAVEELRENGLRESVLLFAIQRSAGMVYGGKYIPVGHIKATLEGLESLEEYLFPEDES